MKPGHTELNSKRIRGAIDSRTVIDSAAVKLVWEHENYPCWYFPIDDVADGSLATSTLDSLSGHVKVKWSDVEHWYEEDIEVFIHPRDPYRRVDALKSSRHVIVRVDGTVVAESHHPTILFETGLRPRYYLPPADVHIDLLSPTDTSTGCPYKGFARYWTVTVDGVEHVDLVWGYDDPLPESAAVAGLMCFYDERVELTVTN